MRLSDKLLRRLEWHVARRLEGQLHGDHRTMHRGAGIDIAAVRPYTGQEDVRFIDWNVTARLDEPHVRQFREDRELTVWLLLDRSSSMHFGPTDRGKDVVVAELALCLARVFTERGDRTAAMLFTDHVEQVLPPRCSRAHVLTLARALTHRPPVTGSSTDVAALVKVANTVIRRKSLVVLVSDFISPPGWQSPLAQLAKRHEVVAIRVHDPLESALPDVGLVIVEDAETGEQVMVDSGDPFFRRRFQEVRDDASATLQATTRRAGVRLHDVATGDDIADALISIALRSASLADRYRRP